jgi:hypothetical protein
MLQTKMAPPSVVLRPYVWAYGMTTGLVGSVPLVIPLPARPKQLLTFSFADPYSIRRPESHQSDASPRVTVVGPQTHARAGLSVCGLIDNFTIHFQPSGFNRLFGIPMTELTDAAYDAYAVIGPEIPRFEHQLGDTPGFAERIQLIEEPLIRMLDCHGSLDPVAIAATACLRATAFIASRRWRPIPGCQHASSRGDSSLRSASRRNSTLGSSDSTPPWITSSDGPAVRGAASPTITISTIRCIWCTTVVPSRESPLHAFWRISKACPSSIRSSRLKTVCDISKSSLSVAFLLSSLAAIHYHPGRDHTSPCKSGAGVSECIRSDGPAGLTSAT